MISGVVDGAITVVDACALHEALDSLIRVELGYGRSARGPPAGEPLGAPRATGDRIVEGGRSLPRQTEDCIIPGNSRGGRSRRN